MPELQQSFFLPITKIIIGNAICTGKFMNYATYYQLPYIAKQHYEKYKQFCSPELAKSYK